MPTSLRFLMANPTPASILRNGRKRFMARWQPRRRCGQWSPDKFATIYELAKTSIGIKDPQRIDDLEIRRLAQDLADAVDKSRFWLDQAVKLVESREDFALLMSLPRIGKPTATALLSAIGHIDEFCCGNSFFLRAPLVCTSRKRLMRAGGFSF